MSDRYEDPFETDPEPSPHEVLVAQVPDNYGEGAELLWEAKREYDRLADLVKKNNAWVRALESVINEQMISEDKHQFTPLSNKYTVHLHVKRYGRANKDRKPELYEWLKNNGYEHLVAEDHNASRLRSAINEIRTANNGEVPSDLEPLIVIDETPTVRIVRK